MTLLRKREDARTVRKPRGSDLKQSKRFIEAARALDCDDDKARFEEKLGKIAKAKPAKEASRERGKG